MQAMKGVIAALLALIVCPCHLPLTMPLVLLLTSGTAVGLWLAAHPQLIWLVMVILFAGSVALAIHWFSQGEASAQGEMQETSGRAANARAKHVATFVQPRCRTTR